MSLSLFNRRSFLSFGAAGVASLFGCAGSGARRDVSGSFDGEVIVIGAGPAGMSAAHLLRLNNVQYTVLEASGAVGGRIQHDLEFADFPISLGAEWIHVEAGVLDEIVNDPGIEVTTELIGYGESTQSGFYQNGELSIVTGDSDSDLKFVGSSWLDFYLTYILPGIAGQVVYNTQVVSIDYSGERIQVVDANGVSRSADRVIVTVPLKQLQNGAVQFEPPLSSARSETIASANVWSGLKAFFEFDQQFYPTFLAFPDSETPNGQRLFYDAAYGQQTSSSILGLFSVGAQAERYQALSDEVFRQTVLAELDVVFDGAASNAYRRHLVQNWNAEPYTGAAYLADVASVRTSRELARPIDNRIFFAGEAYTSFDDWGSVHAAARSAAHAVDAILV